MHPVLKKLQQGRAVNAIVLRLSLTIEKRVDHYVQVSIFSQ